MSLMGCTNKVGFDPRMSEVGWGKSHPPGNAACNKVDWILDLEWLFTIPQRDALERSEMLVSQSVSLIDSSETKRCHWQKWLDAKSIAQLSASMTHEAALGCGFYAASRPLHGVLCTPFLFVPLSTHNWLVVQLNPASAHIAGASDLKLGPCGRRCAVSLFPFSKVARGRRLVLGKSGLRIKAFSDRDMG
jgi:hypothetical protein